MFGAIRSVHGVARLLSLALVTVVILGAVFVAVPHLRSSAVAAAAPEANVWTTCTPVNVTVFTNRVHVKCAQSASGIYYFASSTQDAASAARFLSILGTAQAAGRTLSIWYNPADTSGAAWGCQSNDCRRMQAAAFGQ